MKKSSLFLFSALALCACSSPTDKAEKIAQELPASDGIVAQDLISPEKTVITYALQPDSTIVLYAHDLNNSKTDSLLTFTKGAKVNDVVAINNGYIVISSLPRSDGQEHYLYYASILRNPTDPKASSLRQLFVNEENKNLAATGYVLDKERKTLTLSSYDSNPSTATIYHVAYDFDGNLIANDPAKFTLKPAIADGVTYIWECQNCHKKVNGVTKPKRRSLLEPSTCPCSYDHDWVKIGQVN